MTQRSSRPHTLSRRALLGGATASALLAPFLTRSSARAQPRPGRPTYVVMVTWPEGLEEGWEPSGRGADAVFSPMLAPLAPFQSRMLVVSGLQGGTENILLAHSESTISMWTGARPKGGQGLQELPTRASIDQAIAAQISQDCAYTSLHFGVQTNRVSYISTPYVHFAGPNQPIPAEDDPNAMYQLIFGGASGDEAALARARAQKRSVLDFVAGRLSSLKTRVAAADRDKLEQHAEGVRAIERSLDALATSCPARLPPPMWTREAALDDANFDAVIRLQTDLLVTALQCDLTRVATLQLSNTDSQTVIPGLVTQRTVHAAQHSGTSEERREIGAYFVQKLAYVLERLDSVSLGDGETLLDRTLVVMGSEMARGSHANAPLGYFLAGHTGPLARGRYVPVAGSPRHTKLLTTLGRVMGVETGASFGEYDGEDATGELMELYG